MTHYSTEIASTLSRAAADAYRLKVEARMVGLNWQADDAESIEEDDSTQSNHHLRSGSIHAGRSTTALYKRA